jgi:hypothetical protein
MHFCSLPSIGGAAAALGMSMEELTSLAALVAIASAAFFCVWLLSKRLKSVRACYMLAVFLFAGALVCLWFIDINFPMSTSEFRPGAKSASWWVSGLAFFVRSAAFASIAVAASRHRKAEEADKLLHTTPEIRAREQ